jgi:hypothetical protein
LATAPKGKKKVVRRKKKGGKKNYYFTKDTQNSIIEFKYSEDLSHKQKLYEKEIQPALDKLVENLIFIHNFKSLHDSYEDLKSDTVCGKDLLNT